jgi:hypothetical protein
MIADINISLEPGSRSIELTVGYHPVYVKLGHTKTYIGFNIAFFVVICFGS